jgi:predicted site-specific integrase-resolvase
MMPSRDRTAPVVTVEVAARNYLQISSSLAYRLIRNGKFPVPVLKLGRVFRVPRAPLERLVGITYSEDEEAPRQP